MADLLESFLKEQKAKVANEKVILDQDPPYMEIRALNGDEYKASRKENIPPSMRLNPQAQQANPGKGDSFGLGLPLGEDYERKKRQLQQELRMDYRRYVAQEASRQRKKKKDLNMLQPDQHLDLSLPIGERRSAKDRLKMERNQEYNQFLMGHAGKVKPVHDGDADRPSAPGSFRLAEAASGPQQQHPSRRDAATLTEAERRPPREEHHSETDFSEDEWEHAVAARRHRARHVATRARWHRTPDRDGAEGVDDNLETRPARRRRSRIRTQGRRRPQPPHVPEESDSEANQEMPPVVPRHVNPQMCVSVGTRTATSKEQEELAMGLPIGGTEGEMTRQQKKAQYRQDLLEQIAEQQRNRKREKELELRVAATGAVDPEKQPDRIKHFGAGNYNPDTPGSDLVALEKSAIGRPAQEKAPLETKERAPPARPRIAFQSPLLDYSAALGALAGSGAAAGTTGAGLGSLAQLEDFHRTVSSRLGEITAPQFVGVPPPAPPKVDEAYRTPFDDAYFYYGAMDPLELGSALGGPAGGGAHPVSFLAPGPLRGQPSQAQATCQAGPVSGDLSITALPGQRPRQSKEGQTSYQEALKQQIEERAELRRREEVERERYEARLEAEMLAYDPWGKGGAGAPLKDSHGNLLTDLKMMHRSNKEAYLNLGSRDRWAAGPGTGNIPPQGQDVAPVDHRASGLHHAHTSPFARGKVFMDLPTPHQLQEQERYKDGLRQQIEEKRRREAKERERLRLEDEKEEKRLAEERARIQQEYEDEQRKRQLKKMEQMAKNEELVRQAEERRREAERKKREEEEWLKDAPKEQYERQARQEEVPRLPSPPIPTLQKRLTAHRAARLPSTDTPRSASELSESSIPAPPSPPVPARRNQLRIKEEHAGIISDLSALSRQLRSKQRLLGEQLKHHAQREKLDRPQSVRSRERPLVDVPSKARMQILAPGRGPTNLQNIHDFNQLKYRDSGRREEVQHRYPDPPTDEQSLETQQQVLLRDQRYKMGRLKQGTSADVHSPLVHRLGTTRMDLPGGASGSPLLQSHSVFLQPNEGVMPIRSEWEQSAPSRPREEMHLDNRRGSATRSRGDLRLLENKGSSEQEPQTSGRASGQLDSHSGSSIDVQLVKEHNWQRMRRLEALGGWAEGLTPLGDEGNNLHPRISPSSRERRFSMDTVATEPWLRPGTSDTVKRRVESWMARERLESRKSSIPMGEGPSTFHG